jgi:hypothetical protein
LAEVGAFSAGNPGNGGARLTPSVAFICAASSATDEAGPPRLVRAAEGCSDNKETAYEGNQGRCQPNFWKYDFHVHLSPQKL